MTPTGTLREKSADRFAKSPREKMHARALRTETRMDPAEIDLLDQENALLELDDIVTQVRAMAHVSYDMDIGEVWECLDIWAASGNADAKELLIALKAAVRRALPALELRS